MEIWRSVLNGYYEVSNLGRVRRLKAANRTRVGYILHPQFDGRYLHITAKMAPIAKTVMVHHLVAEAFIGHRPVGKQINHLDGNKLNNCAGNLEYVTPSENQQHASLIGLMPKGESHGNAKLTDERVRAIRLLTRSGFSLLQIARLFHVSKRTVLDVKKLRTWRHVA